MIHPLAYIHPDATLGQNVTVDPFAYIAGDVEIGDNTEIGPHAVILDGARIGRECKIHAGAVISGVPQDLKFKGEYSQTIIGDRNVIRECVTVNRGTAAKGKTVIGNDNLLMAYVHVAHDCVVGNHVVLVNRVSLAGEVEIGDWVILGGHTAVHQFVRVGEHAMTCGGSLVSKDIPPYVKAAHLPVSFVGANYIGLRRRNFNTQQINDIQEVFRILFQSNMNYSNACNLIGETVSPSRERDLILEFVRSSKRGIIKPYNALKKDDDLE